MSKPFILTTGEPAGVGPDLCIQLADDLLHQPVVLCGDIELLQQRAKIHQKDITFHLYGETPHCHNSLAVCHIQLATQVVLGQLNVDNASYVLETLRIAAQGTLNNQYAGIITAPIHKGIICQSGVAFSGHTEFFAEQTQAHLPVMVLGTESCKVGLITTHLPLAKVPTAITAERLKKVIRIINRDMKRYFTAGKPPVIGICGLNPHAGENGHMGMEEQTIINPTLDILRNEGINVSEALPADTLFVPKHAKHYDIIIAMYHDQGLPVIKAQGFGECVNMTFGLPIIRTSVDHGTALDLAGTAQANPNSLRCAVKLAKAMYTIKQKKHV